MTPAVLAPFPRCIPTAPLASRLWTTRTPRLTPSRRYESPGRAGEDGPVLRRRRCRSAPSRCRRVPARCHGRHRPFYRARRSQTGTPPLNCRCFHLRSFVSPSGSLAVATHRTSVREALVRSVSSGGRMPPSDAHRISPRVMTCSDFYLARRYNG